MSLLRFFLSALLLSSFIDPAKPMTALPADGKGLESTVDHGLWTRIFVLDSVRRRIDFVGSVEVNYPGARGNVVELKSLELVYDGETYLNIPLSVTLHGDDGWYVNLNRELEKLPPELSYIYVHRKEFPIDYHERLSDEEQRRIHREVLKAIEDAREDPYFVLHPPVELVKFDVPLTRMIAEEAFQPGLVIPLTIRIRVRSEAGEEVIELKHVMRVDEPLPSGPHGSFRMQGGEAVEIQGTWHYGDLHVHDCKDETSIIGERGCPTCYAESLNWGDDNSLSEMKNQYIAMGADWFTITSHSYCVQNASEYNQIRSQANSLSDPDFLVIPDTELSSEEEGLQEGSDDANLICWNGVNHMGAHWITSWKAGGSDGLLQFCSNPISGFLSNIRDIRGEGGFGIINHPTDDSWAWNSYALTQGFNHPDGLQGVEIWNGTNQVGQGGAVNWWVRKLLDGKPLYAYAGSDTHDDVFDFGWNHVYVLGNMDSNALKEALMGGKVYISKYQSLIIFLHDLLTDRWVMMGSGFAINPNEDLEIVIYYDFGTKTGNIELYKGIVGDTSETLYHLETGLQGRGWLYVQDLSSTPSGFVYYRAYSEVTSGGTFTAYTNPVWARAIARTDN